MYSLPLIKPLSPIFAPSHLIVTPLLSKNILEDPGQVVHLGLLSEIKGELTEKSGGSVNIFLTHQLEMS